MKRIHELANYVGEAYTAGQISSEQAHYIINELTAIDATIRHAKRATDSKILSLHARAEGYY